VNAPSGMTVSPGQRLGAGWGEDGGEGWARRSSSSWKNAAEARSAAENRPRNPSFSPSRPPTCPAVRGGPPREGGLGEGPGGAHRRASAPGRLGLRNRRLGPVRVRRQGDSPRAGGLGGRVERGLRGWRKRPGEAPLSRCPGSDLSARPKRAPRAPKPGYAEGYEVPGVERGPEGWGAGPEGKRYHRRGANYARRAAGEVEEGSR